MLDLRRLKEGIVIELDYAAPIPTRFDTSAIAKALEHYPDQEAVSFMVLGVSVKAELPHQLVLNRHLLSLKGHHEQVFEDKSELAGPPYHWVGIFEESPFLPARCNGNGQVPKGLASE